MAMDEHTNEVVSNTSEHDLILELCMSQALSAHGILSRINNFGFPLLHRIFDNFNDALWKALLELVGIVSENGRLDGDLWQETVRCRSNGGELGMISSDTLVTPHVNIQILSWAKFGDENIPVDRSRQLVFSKVLKSSITRTSHVSRVD